jgi:hypothetical protein
MTLIDRDADPLAGLTDPSLDPIFWPAERLGVPSTWWQHVPFGHWIVCAARPRVVVELGTGTGVSYSAFCQAVVRRSLDSRCYAIDTWPDGADPNVCGEEMFDDLVRFHDERFGAFSTLIRSSFDDALGHFAEGTVDLLHIDGLHGYEAVKNSFENWKPKLSRGSILLLHNTNLRSDNSGVRRLWSELCQQFPNFEFLHGGGLGLLVVGQEVPPAIAALCNIADLSSAALIRTRFAAAGERWLCDAQKRLLVQDYGQRMAAAAAETGRARADTRAWERRANEGVRAREQIALRIDAARRDVYEANLRVEQAEAKVEPIEARAKRAEARAEQAETRTEQAEATAASLRNELEQVVRERDALMSSTVWRATWPLRAAVDHTLPWLARLIRASSKVGDGH